MNNVNGKFSKMPKKFCETSKTIFQLNFEKKVQKLTTETCKIFFILYRKGTHAFIATFV